ncbi:hypothetical protein FNH05_25985 [Amycolatopsis rhizosphaerae]|uniref:Uncharacterized protein n=1 Tax=Amycolatopsis rhizosphaerae TaxID=2053003 RepID=A0A558BGU1_9PSEU|nr:hypothetical protein [Amycolatopsis rhizosphaerae]TVT35722.1 hypothetical protein FNH05_25985 [Amycolatopsis rhizosphaerae]
MDEYRLQDKADARRLLRELRAKEPHHSGTVERARDIARPTGAGSAELVGEDGGRIELDPGEIAAAEAELGRRYDELAGLLERARELEAPLQDGSGPVSAHLRKAFHLRGSAEFGVQATLRDYLDELSALRDAIRQAAAGHEQNEAEARAALGALRADNDR